VFVGEEGSHDVTAVVDQFLSSEEKMVIMIMSGKDPGQRKWEI
jgi:hypothetical protein